MLVPIAIVAAVLYLMSRAAPPPFEDLLRSRTASEQGIDNRPSPSQREALQALYEAVLVPLAGVVGSYTITSGYRSPDLNDAVDGSPNSQHMRGEAADIAVPGLDALQVIDLIRRSGLPYDQIVGYPGTTEHVHVSYSADGDNRREILLKMPGGGYRDVS